MTQSRSLAKKYSHVLVGLNMTSLQWAQHLIDKGEDFCLLDSRFMGSGPFKEIPSLATELFVRLPYNSALDDLDINSVPGPARIEERPPLTFEKGQFRSFLGFGNTEPEERDVIEKYCQPQALVPQMRPEEFWAALKETIAPHLFLDQNPTRLLWEDNSLVGLQVNGNKVIQGDRFYFFSHLPFVFDQVGSLSKKTTSAFAKRKWWSSVNLVIHHAQDLESVEIETLYLLMGSKQQACLGQFHRHEGHLISRWESFFPAELTPDSETTGAALKEIKKQVKRAFPQWESQPQSEHILVHDHIHADLSGLLEKGGKIKNINGLTICSPLVQPQIGWVHDRAQALELIGQNDLEDEKKPGPTLNEVAGPSSPC